MIDFDEWGPCVYDEPAGACEACGGYGELAIASEWRQCAACRGSGLDGDGYVGCGGDGLRVPLLDVARVSSFRR